MMRSIAMALAVLAATSPASAWEFAPSPICTLSHSEAGSEVAVTYDPTAIEAYAIAVTHPDGWSAGPVFEMRFDGANSLTISTPRHRYSDDGSTLTVSDTGFGNVLNGLAFNTTATAFVGESAVTFSLAGSEPEVRKFLDCTRAPVA